MVRLQPGAEGDDEIVQDRNADVDPHIAQQQAEQRHQKPGQPYRDVGRVHICLLLHSNSEVCAASISPSVPARSLVIKWPNVYARFA